jgi:uncharacterized protein
MIKKADSNLQDKLLEFLKREVAFNQFIIGDIELFGFDKEFQEVWVEYSEAEDIKAVLLRYYDFFLLYGDLDFNVEGFANLIRKASKSAFLSGKKELVQKFEESKSLKLKKNRELYLSILDKNSVKCSKNHYEYVKKANVTDIDRLVLLRDQIEEFNDSSDLKDKKILEENMNSGASRTYYIEKNNEIIASASTTAESSISAMIVGVGTHPAHRGKGLATIVMESLITDLLNEGKVVGLLYDNPIAGNLYMKLGFKNIGKWSVYKIG